MGPTSPLKQLTIARIGPNHVIVMALEELVQKEPFLTVIEVGCGATGHVPNQIGRASVGKLLHLFHEAGNEIKGGLHRGERFEHFHHVDIILGGVEPDPGHLVFTGADILVKGLMHVPEKGDLERFVGHDGNSSTGKGAGIKGKAGAGPRPE
jgi:hypothetical protein